MYSADQNDNTEVTLVYLANRQLYLLFKFYLPFARAIQVHYILYRQYSYSSLHVTTGFISSTEATEVGCAWRSICYPICHESLSHIKRSRVQHLVSFCCCLSLGASPGFPNPFQEAYNNILRVIKIFHKTNLP